MDFLPFVLASLAGFKVCNIFTHPRSKVWNNLPRLQSKRVDLFPSLRIKIKGRVVHFHHWLNFSILLGVSIFVTRGLLDSWIVRGLLMGGVIQGLSTPSARKIIYKEDWLLKMLK